MEFSSTFLTQNVTFYLALMIVISGTLKILFSSNTGISF